MFKKIKRFFCDHIYKEGSKIVLREYSVYNIIDRKYYDREKIAVERECIKCGKTDFVQREVYVK